MADDEFWNESQVKTSAQFFSFDERESGGDSGSLQMCGISLDGTAQLFQQIQAGLKQSDSDTASVTGDIKNPTQFELHQLVSEKTLNCFMEADFPQDMATKSGLDPAEEVRILQRKLNDFWITPDPKKTVVKMMLKQPFLLELFRSLESKKQLLQEAILLGDGDTILTVVVFLSKTLKRTYFNQIMLEMPVAATHYAAYLSTRVRTAELTDLLEMLGKNKDAAMKQFEIACQNPRQLQRLQVCAKNHIFEGKDRKVLESYVSFLEWKAETGVEGESVTDCLSRLCEKHWAETKENLSPLALTQRQGVSDKQYQWVAITALAKLQAWQDIQSFLTAKSWLRQAKMRVSLPMEHVITLLHTHGAPQDVLYTFLLLIDNLDKRLALARLVACDKAVIEVSMNLRDKHSLPSFRATLPTS